MIYSVKSLTVVRFQDFNFNILFFSNLPFFPFTLYDCLDTGK